MCLSSNACTSSDARPSSDAEFRCMSEFRCVSKSESVSFSEACLYRAASTSRLAPLPPITLHLLALGWVIRGGGLGWLDQNNFSGFELCSPFLTYTPSFIQIGPKLAKLVLWGGLGGGGRGVRVV